MKLFITGVTGFIGSRIAQLALEQDLNVVGQSYQHKHPLVDTVRLDINGNTNWRGCLTEVDCVIHCAAKVHDFSSDSTDYDEINTQGTLHLAQQAAAQGVKRFVFVSSIKVNGEFSFPSKPLTETVHEPPLDPYGKSKYKAELGLLNIAEKTGMEIVIVRPPLVYGPGVKANFYSMMKWVKRRIPLPLGAIDNRRSMIFVDNLADFLLLTCTHPNAANEIFLISDDDDVSTSRLLKLIAQKTPTKSCLIPVPQPLLCSMLSLVGLDTIAQKIVGNLQVDIGKAKYRLNWRPKYTLSQGIERTVNDFQNKNRSE